MTKSIDATLLKALRDSAVHLPASELAAQAGSEPAVVFERIAELRAAGYEIDEQPHLGYRLVSAPDRLIADDLRALLDGCRFGREILVLKETASTNDVAAQLGRGGAAEGLVVLAETQTAGRGRLGRKWESASHEGLWFSILIRPHFAMSLWTRLTTWAAVSIAEGIESVVPCLLAIKWPNDLFLGDKKVVGILIESHIDKGGFAVVGIGVNVNQTAFPDAISQTAASLRQAAGSPIDRQLLAASIIRRLAARFEELESEFSNIVAEAEARSFLQGRWVETRSAGEVTVGLAEGLDENGALRLRTRSGEVITLPGGEVSVRPRPAAEAGSEDAEKN